MNLLKNHGTAAQKVDFLLDILRQDTEREFAERFRNIDIHAPAEPDDIPFG